MAEQASGRVDPRELLRSSRARDMDASNPAGLRALARAAAIGVAATVGLASFGTLVVKANDDSGAFAFIRAQTRPRPALIAYAPPRPAYPVSYYAPRGFLSAPPPAVRRAQAPPPRVAQGGRNRVIVASYAPFAGLFPADAAAGEPASRRRTAARGAPSVSKPTLAAPFAAVRGGGRDGRITYCVRTCDGFYFPLSVTTGSDRDDQAACNRLCPTAETRLYVGQTGADMDESRARQTGRRYAQMSTAFAYRRGLDKSCSCSAGGVGLTNEASVYRDPTLKVGDVVMTPKGMRVFTGGRFPYREANFTTIDRSRQLAGGSRETLRGLEQASMPGRSGVAQRPPQRRTDEVADLRRAAAALRAPEQLVRYVGPDRTAVAR
jgi:Protein of unknown function (DUF2865)